MGSSKVAVPGVAVVDEAPVLLVADGVVSKAGTAKNKQSAHSEDEDDAHRWLCGGSCAPNQETGDLNETFSNSRDLLECSRRSICLARWPAVLPQCDRQVRLRES